MEELEHEHHELRLLQLLARGEKEIEAGKGCDLDTVVAEADYGALILPREERERITE